jgi:mannosyltransferase
MHIYLDNIIFSLQKHGGISVVWYEFIKRILVDSDFNCEFIELPNQNNLRAQLDIPSASILKNNLSYLPLKIQRYINPKVSSNKCIFHSSYFRTVDNPNVLNITTVHDFIYEYFVTGLPQKIHACQKGNAIKHSKKIICVSKNTKYDLFKFYPQIKEEQVEVIYNGVSEDYFPIIQTERISIVDLIPFQRGEYVIYVGERKSEYKNFKLVVEACLLAKYPLVIVGGGSLTSDENKFLAMKLGTNKFKQLMGIRNSELNQLYNQAAFLIYPSIYEGFGIPILEAQKAGCPVICSNTSSIPEVAGQDAFLLDHINAEQIAEILLTNKSRSTFVTNIIREGFVNAERFSWDQCYKQTKQLYSDIYSEYFSK